MKTTEGKTIEKKHSLSNFKKMLTRDEMKKVMGGYIYCYGPGQASGSGYCPTCQFAGQIVPNCGLGY